MEPEETKADPVKSQRDKYQLAKVTVPNQCRVCSGPLVIGGPIWNDKIHNIDFVKRLLEVARKNSKKDLPEAEREVNLGTSNRI